MMAEAVPQILVPALPAQAAEIIEGPAGVPVQMLRVVR
jgi:hypothetical protein